MSKGKYTWQIENAVDGVDATFLSNVNVGKSKMLANQDVSVIGQEWKLTRSRLKALKQTSGSDSDSLLA